MVKKLWENMQEELDLEEKKDEDESESDSDENSSSSTSEEEEEKEEVHTKGKKEKHRRNRSSSSSSSRSRSRKSKQQVKNTRSETKVLSRTTVMIQGLGDTRSIHETIMTRNQKRQGLEEEKQKVEKKREKSRKHRSTYSSRDSSSSSSSSSSSNERWGEPNKLPKNLKYDGNTKWLSFKTKFESYKKVGEWSKKESRDYLLWWLEGKVLDFVTNAMSENNTDEISYKQLMKKLEGRFGSYELTDSASSEVI